MMKNNSILTIFKKELVRFFTDRRTLAALLLPGILIYVIYSLMGNVMSDTFMPSEGYKPDIAVINMPNSLRPALSDPESFMLSEPGEDVEADIKLYKELIAEGSKDLLLIFPADFDAQIVSYTPASGAPAPNIEIYYNSSDTDSSMSYGTVTAIFDIFESSMANKFDINRPSDSLVYDLASEEDLTAMMFSMVMPMILMSLLFSGCMSVAPESIAGEKERGTIASLLITPVKRTDIAVGKLLALSVMALISGTSSTVGVILSLPKLMGSELELDGSVYSVSDYTMLGVVILSTVLLLITVISIISANAKTVKEASSSSMPLMLLSMLIGLSGMMGSAAAKPALYLIPLYNSVQCMTAIFSFEANVVNMAITVAVNLALSALGVFILTRMFNSERVMFNK